MARARNIKPGFFTNAELLECQPLARLLFVGLWTEADCRGILEDRPKTLKIKVLPVDNCDVESLLCELEAQGFITRYVVGDTRCILVNKFEQHQNPHQNEKPNQLPAPELHQSTLVPAPELHQSDPAEPLLPITETPLLIPETNARGASGPVRDAAVSYTSLFEEFWLAYPSGHGSKKAAFAQWQRLKPDEALRSEIMVGLEAWQRSDQWARGYIKAGERWIRDRLWENPPPVNGPVAERKLTVTEKNMRNADNAMDILRQMQEKQRSDGVIEAKGSVIS